MHKAIPLILFSAVFISVLMTGCNNTVIEEPTTDTNEKIIETIEKSKPVTQGNLITKTNTDDEGKVSVEYYDSFGNLVESYLWNNNEVLSHSIITYTPDNNIQRKEEIDANGLNSSIESFKYDNEGNLQSKTFNEFTDGRLTKSTNYDSGGNVTGYSVSEYNDDDLLVKINRYDNNDSLLDYYTYEYNDKSQAVRYSGFDSEDNLLRYTVFDFNDKGLIQTEKYYDSNNNLESYYSFTYDENGNMIMSSSFDAEGNLISEDIFDIPQNP